MTRAGPKRTVLFVSSNGIGLGHLTRQMAIAERLPPDCRPLFMTMSYAAPVLKERGFAFLFVPHHTGIGFDVEAWNEALCEEIDLAARHFEPAVLVYDATVVFGGVLEAMALHRGMTSVWIRRPMWRETQRAFLAQSGRFDVVVEPQDLAEDLDEGPTREFRDRTVRVPPILHFAPDDRLERAAARDALGLDRDAFVVAMQFGSGANFDVEALRRQAVAQVLRHPEAILVEIVSPIRAFTGSATPPTGDPRHRRIELFPAFRYSRAFDGAISAAGYNSFHEAILGAVPTIFVPNEAEDMDLQLNRARWAEGAGCGWALRRGDDGSRVAATIEALFDPAENLRVAERCRAIAWTNGADAVAELIGDRIAAAGELR